MASLVDELDTRHVDIGIFPALHVFGGRESEFSNSLVVRNSTISALPMRAP